MKKLIPALEFPMARGDPQSGYMVHGRWFDDPYAWLERLDDPETQAWIAAQEAVTHSVLSAVPGRDWLRAAVALPRRHAQLSPPMPAGPNGHEFLWQADASEEKLKFMLRRGKDAPLETVLDPNTWASEEVLVFAVPSPDGTLVAFGKSVGSAHDAVTHVLDVETGRLLSDRPRGTSHESLAWRPDGSGFFYAAYPEPGEVPAGDESQWHAVRTVTGVGGRLYAVYSYAASHRVRIHAEDGTYLRELALPGLGSVNHTSGGGVISGVRGAWGGDDEVWVDFTSYVQPPSVYRYDYEADCLTPHYVPDVGLDASAYVTDQVWYASRDGTQVSMFIIHRKDMPRDGRRPVRLSGYGGFNISVQPTFTALNAAWLQLGGVLAYPNIRGGGEYGRGWHEAAVKTRRQNAFDDYIAAAQWLVSAGYTTPSKLVSRGNSNGGLLVAVTAMQAPEAFGAFFSRVPNLDMLGFRG